MLAIAVGLNVLAGLGMLAMAAKYLRTGAPIDYHGEILQGQPLSDEMRMILAGLYRVVGGAFAALGLATIGIAVFGVSADLLWAKLLLPVSVVLVGGVCAVVPYRVEAQTGVRTPWRIAAALTGMVILASVFALV